MELLALSLIETRKKFEYGNTSRLYRIHVFAVDLPRQFRLKKFAECKVTHGIMRFKHRGKKPRDVSLMPLAKQVFGPFNVI